MKVLVVGGGGREHAIAWKAARSPLVDRVYVAPGNAGTALEPGVENVPIDADDIPALARFASDQAIGLTIVGPEAPLVAGIAGHFDQLGLPCFGPGALASRLEGSKAFTKRFLHRHAIPTAEYGEFTSLGDALEHIDSATAPLVVKADGLAAGKGVVIARTREDARTAARAMLEDRVFGSAGTRIVIEEFLEGEEASFIALVDGEQILPLASSQDHKARDEGDTGPNTGGMGAYSPAPIVDDAMHERIMREVIRPTVTGLAAEGMPYRGFLYAGLMIGADGTPKVLEYNCRCGDPETQPIMMRLRSDLVALCLAAIDGRLDEQTVKWDSRAALGVVLAADGYPDRYRKGQVIAGLPPEHEDCKVFHAGTAFNEADEVVTAGGRVLCVVGLGTLVSDAGRLAYAAADSIRWNGVYYRRDIGHRAIARERAVPGTD